LIPEQVGNLIGKAQAPVIYEVERGAIRKYADAIADRNPLYWDEEHARNSRYGSIIAPPGFAGWPTQWTGAMPFLPPSGIRGTVLETMAKLGYPRVLDGGVEFEFMLPVRAGDILVGSTKVLDIYERESKGSKMMFCVFEITYTNQNSAVAFKMRQTLICR
jgi:acyl dehydratase